VALGAAVQTGLVGRVAAVEDLVTDVAPFTLGISEQLGGDLRDGYFDPVIDRNTTIPVSRVKRYSTVYPNQTSLVVRVFQGESRRIEDNLPLGEFEVRGIPPVPPSTCASPTTSTGFWRWRRRSSPRSRPSRT
jgi:molecular chaperone HscC